MRNFIVVSCVITLFCFSETHAVVPYFNSYGWLYLNDQDGYTAHTETHAVMGGVEQWHNAYWWLIYQYINFGSFYDYLYRDGQWVYMNITPRVLAEQIWCDWDLGLWDVPSNVVDLVEEAITDERNYGHSSQYDPFSYWKWRSRYMEERYAENNFDTAIFIHANCWGTADYLAMDYEWAGKYAQDFPSGAPDWERRFPHIYLDGGDYYGEYQHNEYCIDDDLNSYVNYRSIFKGHRPGTEGYPQPGYLLNSFDVIRLAADPLEPYPTVQRWEMGVDGVNVGENLHCVAYICTDRQQRAWIYEKHNYGATMSRPYGLNILGSDQWTDPVGGIGMYDFSYCSFFKKYGYNKANVANGYELNWAGIVE